MRSTVEKHPELLAVNAGSVTLSDPRKDESIRELAKELVKTPLCRRKINPDEAEPVIREAARLAGLSRPENVAEVLLYVAKKTLRKLGSVKRGKHPANMPLVVACIVDRVIASERRKGTGQKFEKVLGPYLKSMIFERWALGMVPGSQFLANILIMWERLGYFKGKQLDACKKPLMVLLAYARREGVPDPDKEKGAGWYKVIHRDPAELAAAEAAFSRQLLRRKSKPKPPLSPKATSTAPTHPPTVPGTDAPTADAQPTLEAPTAEGPAVTEERKYEPTVEGVTCTPTETNPATGTPGGPPALASPAPTVAASVGTPAVGVFPTVGQAAASTPVPTVGADWTPALAAPQDSGAAGHPGVKSELKRSADASVAGGAQATAASEPQAKQPRVEGFA